MQEQMSLICEKVTKDSLRGNIPPEREAFSLAYLSDKKSFLLFGGMCNGSNLNDLYTFSFQDKQWKKEETNGEVPKEMSRFAYWYDGKITLLN